MKRYNFINFRETVTLNDKKKRESTLVYSMKDENGAYITDQAKLGTQI